ncbi:Nucleosomal histone kinase 1 [Pseudolycoriella hygida]|uniref:non-specific serine/threonine protein kinase n=1 Tax=Pseudolycoriella hygida TaxID=35572 RepID=A0A9Q0MV59_9DIPT|nr:Nucleosomal histone kinase 1 [Pseudolycoriella hygida]
MPARPKAAAKAKETGKAVGGVKKKVTAKGYKKPAPIPIGEILTDVARQQWKVGPSIGSGGFGEIYSACKVGEGKAYNFVVKIEPHENGPLFVEMHFYSKNAKMADIEQYRKNRKLKSLGMPNYVGHGSHELNGLKHRFVVMPLYGRDVWSFFLENGKILPQGTIYRIAIQMLDVLEYIHQCTYVHADLKGANILLGQGKNGASQAYLVDFGLVSHYTNKDFKPDPKKMHNGTIEYTSRDAHNGVPTMRGDMEILAYNVVHWSGVTLPWEADGLLSVPKKVQESKENFMSDVVVALKKCFPACPDTIVDYLKYVATLKYNDTPDYGKCRQMFENGLKKLGEKNDGDLIFDLKSTAGPSKKETANKTTKAENKKGKKPVVVETANNSGIDVDVENISPVKEQRKRAMVDEVKTPSEDKRAKMIINSGKEKTATVQSGNSVIVNSSPAKGKSKAKIVHVNLELDVSVDANIVLSVSRKSKKGKLRVVSESTPKIEKSVTMDDDNEDIIPNSNESTPVAKVRSFRRKNTSQNKNSK